MPPVQLLRVGLRRLDEEPPGRSLISIISRRLRSTARIPMDTTPQKMWSTRNPPSSPREHRRPGGTACVHDRSPSHATRSSLSIRGQVGGRSPAPRKEHEHSSDGDRETRQDDEQRSGRCGFGGGATAEPRAGGRGFGRFDRSIVWRCELVDDRGDRREQRPGAISSDARVPPVRTPSQQVQRRFERARGHLSRTEGCVASSSSRPGGVAGGRRGRGSWWRCGGRGRCRRGRRGGR